jgi:hypothetical protein
MSLCLVADLGGLPMIDDGVKHSAIATLACAVRQRLDNKRQPLSAYLQPGLAKDCYRRASQRLVTELESIDPSPYDMQRIQGACDRIVEAVPQWKVQFALPLRWRRLVNDVASSSNPMIPQHIYLGERGLTSHRLPEYIVHEISHTWVGMIAEVAPLALPGEAVHVLPSGTTNKEIRQVMYALTFAATAVRFYRARIAQGQHHEQDRERLEWMEQYTSGCLDIVEPSALLLPNGRLMAESCRRILLPLKVIHGQRSTAFST